MSKNGQNIKCRWFLIEFLKKKKKKKDDDLKIFKKLFLQNQFNNLKFTSKYLKC